MSDARWRRHLNLTCEDDAGPIERYLALWWILLLAAAVVMLVIGVLL